MKKFITAILTLAMLASLAVATSAANGNPARFSASTTRRNCSVISARIHSPKLRKRLIAYAPPTRASWRSTVPISSTSRR